MSSKYTVPSQSQTAIGVEDDKGIVDRVWHKYKRNLTSHPEYKSIIAAAKNRSILTRAKIDMLLRWLWYFARH